MQHSLNPSKFQHKVGIASIISGLMLGLSVLPSLAQTSPRSVLNPCPSLYYEEPHNTNRLVPPGCPPNAATQRVMQEGGLPARPLNNSAPAAPAISDTTLTTPDSSNVTPSTLPTLESTQSAIATITPTAGAVNVRLRNDTNTGITYQATGYTQERTLTPGQEIVLQDLPTPVTINIVRQDNGLIQVKPISTTESGLLAISLDETADLGQSQRTIRVQSDGQVFAY
ncbi:MAG TPA: hypothetical protein V6C78_24595 [Crinalium sp.]